MKRHESISGIIIKILLLLAALYRMKHLKKVSVIFLIDLVVMNFILPTRLTPPYAMVILFNATLYRHVATGPLLEEVTNEMAENCQKYWWTNILYINNYVGVDHTVSIVFMTFIFLV
jgi:hypothetical protein